MSQIMKAFTGVFVVLYMMVTAAGILSCFFQVMHAQNLHAAIIDEVENSNYSPSVLRACFQSAEVAGYDLELTLYHNHIPYEKITEKEQIADELEDTKMAKVELTYPIQVAFFQMELQQELCGYAR